MTFEPESKQDILDVLIEGAEQAFGQELDPNQASVIEGHYDSIASYFAYQQQLVADVLRDASLETAEGEALDKRGALVGVPRKEALGSRGYVEFRSDTGVDTTRRIEEGTVVQTDGTDPIEFETTVVDWVYFVDGFEDGTFYDTWSGDVGEFQISAFDSYEGDYTLRATSGSSAIITHDNRDMGYGSQLEFFFKGVGATDGAILFGHQDDNNYYRARVSPQDAEISIDTVVSGAVDNRVSDGGNIENTDWYKCVLEWKTENQIRFDIEHLKSGDVTHSVVLNESSRTYEAGNIGIEDVNGSNVFYIDEIAMSGIDVPVESVGTGAITNVSKGTINTIKGNIIGIEAVNNPVAATGGRSVEDDEIYRSRIQNELSEGGSSTVAGIISAVERVDGVRTVTIIDNDTATDDSDGRPPHSFELIADVDSDTEADVAQAIVESKGAGTTSVGGYAGSSVTYTTDLPNDDTKDITYSVPSQVEIYYDINLTKTRAYEGDEAVRNAIVNYTGGRASDGSNVSGELNVNEDVISDSIVAAIMSVDGVKDITNLELDTSSGPTNQGNISIAQGETAYTDALDTTAVNINSSDA